MWGCTRLGRRSARALNTLMMMSTRPERGLGQNHGGSGGRSSRAGDGGAVRTGGGGGKPRGGSKPKTWAAPVELPTGVAGVEPPAGWVERAAQLGVVFEAGDVERLGRYLGLLLATTTVMNLTATKDAGEAWDRHVLDSLTLLPVLGEAEIAEGRERLRVLDVGSGGGLPGLVLACVMPGADFVLLDSTEKKCRFLKHAAGELGLLNVEVVHARAEEAGHDRGTRVDSGGVSRREGTMRDGFDVVTARAVGGLATLSELTVPFARVGGLCALIKGQKAEEELAAAKAGLHLLLASHAGTVETPTGRVVVLEKRRATPRMYPRANGEPKRKPLGVDG